jgi:hypothetical protein
MDQRSSYDRISSHGRGNICQCHSRRLFISPRKSAPAGRANQWHWYDGQQWQAFAARLINSGGTLQHWIRDASNSGSANNAVARAISGRSSSLTNTPTGPDASTAFAAGVKISSATSSQLIFDYSSCSGAEEILRAYRTSLKQAACTSSKTEVSGPRTRAEFQCQNPDMLSVSLWIGSESPCASVELNIIENY